MPDVITEKNYVINQFPHSEFLDKLKNYVYNLIRTTADGNCLFRSISYLLNNTEDDHQKIRNDLCDYLLVHKNKFYLDFNVNESNIEPNLSNENYCWEV